MSDHPIHFEDHIIGYIRVEPFKKITDALDKEFINHQLEAFFKIALTSLLFILSGAWFVGRYLKKRFSALEKQANELTAGNYTIRSAIHKRDEIGRLATHLDTLAITLERNQRSRQQWIADISHELRTPLAILKGETEALIDGIRPLKRQAIHSLASEIERLNNLVEDLYQLSLSDVGALNYKKEPIELVGLLEDILDTFSTRMAEHDLQLTVDLDPCRDIDISGDSARLTQLFINLLENAIRYTNQGGAIKVSGNCKNEQLQLIIEDSAPTVATEKLPHLFERLYRSESSRNRNTGGAGLGLAICKEIVNAHQGKIEAKHSGLGGIAIQVRFPIID
ncbi:MAG: Sensory histidine kinase BaeS [uncultured Thiotrichaceae bacterium]|uniref:histidine kinase n=1 Tax=uncultured Thiotrichaceae bacterium TaxID=298394 RepID=A0A6S6SFL1_9GAMM|nr:MAG: Sensory histidine kinase BaeS [uncultured Thiotrichaceae bacterium]